MTIESSGISQTFYDGGFHDNNPINQVMNECNRLDPGRKIGCVISLGTGVKASEGLKGSSHLLTLAISLAKEASNCDRTHHLFTETKDGGSLADEHKYFRFSVGKNLDQVNLDEWQSFGAIHDYVEEYVRERENRTQIQKCAELLLSSRVEAPVRPSLNAQRPFSDQITPTQFTQNMERLRSDAQASSISLPMTSAIASYSHPVIPHEDARLSESRTAAHNPTASRMSIPASFDQLSLLTIEGDAERQIST